MKTKLRVKLFGDPLWVLGYIGRETCERVNSTDVAVSLSTKAAPADHVALRAAERDCEVIHFLNPWDFIRLDRATTRPTVVTYHHIVDGSWSVFDEHYAQADAICAATPAWREEFDRRRSDQTAAIHLTLYGIDGERFRPLPEARQQLRKRLGLAQDAIVLGFSSKKEANFRGRKGPDRYFTLLRALRQAQGERVRLVMFGEGWAPEDVPEDVRGLVSIPGYLPYEELPILYGGLDYYVCLSTCEGGPYPVLECLACGVKVISTPVGAVPFVIRNRENGFLVGHDDFLKRIPLILEQWTQESPTERSLRQEARISVLERHAWDRVVDPRHFERIYLGAVEHWRLRQSLGKRLRNAIGRRLRWPASVRGSAGSLAATCRDHLGISHAFITTRTTLASEHE